MNKNERRNNALQESRSVSENLTFMERLRGLRLDFSLDGESILKGIDLRGSPCIFLLAPDDAVHKIPTARWSSGSCLAARYSHFYDGKGTLGRNNWANRSYSNRITRRIYIYDSADSLYLRGIFLRDFDYVLLPRFGSDARTLHPCFDCGESIFHAHRPFRNDRKRDINRRSDESRTAGILRLHHLRTATTHSSKAVSPPIQQVTRRKNT